MRFGRNNRSLERSILQLYYIEYQWHVKSVMKHLNLNTTVPNFSKLFHKNLNQTDELQVIDNQNNRKGFHSSRNKTL